MCVPSECNPAELPSRGCSLSRLIQSKWWEGPSWLKLTEEYWPSRYKDLNEEEICAERKKPAKIQTRSGRTVCITNRLDDYYCFSVCLEKNRKSEQSQARQGRDRVHTARARSLETSEQSQARQGRDRVHTALARSLETSEQSQARQERDRIRRTQTRRTMHTDLNLCGFIYNPYYNYSLHPRVIIGKWIKSVRIVVLKN
ncbi:hypothetical protein LAZ67_21001455 [Cordylochernes scorpioides]|uniref:Uncharacterized protein n=1 Tax=Cordylochernes scorpioides TaxID=51811 RepID=A0ABY6LQ18_9ARAC|nr:hypothetical protein LAZ67_21001455 [Cordylochernes scorpioides]